jgi:hypothetical protein
LTHKFANLVATGLELGSSDFEFSLLLVEIQNGLQIILSAPPELRLKLLWIFPELLEINHNFSLMPLIMPLITIAVRLEI